ncbi:MAG: hypothetical protein IJ727_10135 [Treponema sp.]|nr:hypothetical protein [Treponema sp.]
MNVIIADGSAVVRAILEQNLNNYPSIEISASVSNIKKVVQFARIERPDLIICDIDESEDEELSALKTVSRDMRIPVILLAEKGSIVKGKTLGELLEKPPLNSYKKDFFDLMVKKIEKLVANPSFSRNDVPSGVYKILCIGASTGGPSAVSEVLSALGPNFPLPILYAQHIEVGADGNMVKWLSSVCRNVHVKLAQNGEEARAGTVYMAPADKHLVIEYLKSNGNPVLKLSDEEPERFLRPAVNKLFRSAAKFYRKNCLAVLLTGMGQDGAEGCKEICDNDGWTIVEDKSTCAVFGMPAAAIEAGGAKEVLPRPEISKRILKMVIK